MRNNRFGQGLAASAVSALVITGLTFGASPAHAADGSGVRLLSQQDGIASVRSPYGIPGFPSGMSTTTLAAEQLDPTATISFEYNADPAADDAATGWLPATSMFMPSTQGPYTTIDWAPDASLVGTSIAIRAVASTPTATTYSRRNNVALSGDGSPVNSVWLGSAGPFFAQPYADSDRTDSLMAVSGSTSAADGSVELSVWNSAEGTFTGSTQAAVSFQSMKTPGTPFPFASGSYTGVLDITAFDAEAGDTLAVRAERDSDDVMSTQLQAQTITSISASTEGLAGPETTAVTLHVADEVSRPVVGAEVRRSSDGKVVGYTDGSGDVVAEQPSGSSETYYANTTDADAYEDGVDVTTAPVQAPDYVPVATATIVELVDGDVFDDREYAEGDIALQVVDGRGDPFAAEEEVTYALLTPGADSAEPVTATTDSAGRLVVPFDPEAADGTYVLAYTAPNSAGGAEQEPVTFTAGEAELGLTPVKGTAPSGGRITYAGTLTVEGRPLAGRDVDVVYTPGNEQAPGTGSDAALLDGEQRLLSNGIAASADGTFSVTVSDLVEAGSPAETGGTLQVTARGLGASITATADFTAVAVTPPVTPPVAPTGKAVVELTLAGADAKDGADRIKVRGPKSVAGQRVRFHVQTPGGFWRVLKAVDLDAKGDATLEVDDLNGDKATRYRVRLLPNQVAKAFTSKVLRLR